MNRYKSFATMSGDFGTTGQRGQPPAQPNPGAQRTSVDNLFMEDASPSNPPPSHRAIRKNFARGPGYGGAAPQQNPLPQQQQQQPMYAPQQQQQQNYVMPVINYGGGGAEQLPPPGIPTYGYNGNAAGYPVPPPPNDYLTRPSLTVCESAKQHLRSCVSCQKCTRRNPNMYIAVIVALILIIMFLLTKIVDKFGS